MVAEPPSILATLTDGSTWLLAEGRVQPLGAARPLSSPVELRDAWVAAMQALPDRRAHRALVAVLPSPWCRTVAVEGVPELTPPSLYGDIVRANPARFVIAPSAALVVGGAVANSPGPPRVALADQELCLPLAQAVRRSGRWLCAIVPLDAMPALAACSASKEAIERVADASVRAFPECPTISPRHVTSWEVAGRARALTAAVVALVAVCAMLVAPVALPRLAAWRAERRADAILAAQESAARRRAPLRAQVGPASLPDPGRLTYDLARVAQALAPDDAMESFAWDSGGVSLTVSTQDAYTVVSTLGRLRGFAPPDIGGQLDYESASAGETARHAVRLTRIARAAP